MPRSIHKRLFKPVRSSARRLARRSPRFAVACAITATLLTACVKLPRHEISPRLARLSSQSGPDHAPETPRVNINLASAAELEKLPGVGPALAARIVEHRERYGPFRRPEHLIILRGFSERRFKELRPLITIDE